MGIICKCGGEVTLTRSYYLYKNEIVAQIPSALSDDTPINVHNVLTSPPWFAKKWMDR